MTETKYPETLELSMLAVQTELTNPIKDATNPHFKSKYATLPEIRNLVTPILAKYGLYVSQPVDTLHGETSNTVVLNTTITHAPTGKKLSSEMPLMLERQTPQGQGSAITYARRYALCAILNIAADEDDDGQEAEKPKPKVDPISRERKAFIIESINNAKDVATVKKLNTEAKAECMKANDEKAYDEILKAAKERINQLQPPQENTIDQTS